MQTITNRNFFELLKETINENEEDILNDWSNYKRFTNLIKGNENSILKQIANKFELQVYEIDYYSLDAIFYKNEDLCPEIKGNAFWFRNIQIAFEHENNFKSGLYQELSHLIVTNSELKVLVTYPNDEDDGYEMLKKFTDIILGNRSEKEFSDNESILVIYGYKNELQWDGFIYGNSEWLKI